MADTEIKPITSGYNVSKINDNFDNIQAKLDGPVLSSSDGQNTMYQDFDMNSNNILNAKSISTSTLMINGSAVVPADLGAAAPGSVGTIQLIDGSVTDSKIVNVSGNKASFTQVGAGAVLRDLQGKGRERVTPQDFGALGTGDNAYAAFNQLVANNPHGPISVPAGLYQINTNLTIPNDISFDSGAVIYPGLGVTVTFTGAILAGDYQIFNKANGGTISLQDVARSCRTAWFGMLPRNTASVNTLAFADTIAALTAQDASATIKFPAGNVNVNTLTCNTSFYTLDGYGTWLINNTTNQPALEINNINSFYNVVKGFRVGQSASVSALSGNCGIHIKGQNTTLQDNTVSNFPARLYDGYFIDGALGMKFYNNNANGCWNNGWHFGNSCGDLFGWANYGNANLNNGFYFNGMSGLYAQALNGYANTNYAFYFDNVGTPNGSGTINEFVYGFGWIGDTSGSANWNILNLADSSFDSCWGSTQISPSTNTTASGFNISGSGCKDLSFNGCHALTNNGAGYVVDQGATNITFHGCHARGNGLGGTSVDSGFYIGLGAAVTNITALGCRARGNVGYGMRLGGFASDYLIVNSCNNQGNGIGTLQNNATGTHNNIGIAGNL